MKSLAQFTMMLRDIYDIKIDMFWQEQYALYANGVRDGRIHDTTFAIMNDFTY